MVDKSIRTLIATAFAAALCAACTDGSSPLGGGDDDDDGGTPGNAFHFSADGYMVQTGEYYHCFFRDFETGASASEKVGMTRIAYDPDQGVLHHIVIFSANTSEGNTDRDCELLENNWLPRYAGGTNTDPLVMPEGVAMELDDVEHFVIQFHYLNVDVPVADYTTVDIDLTSPGDDFIGASLIVSGKTDFSIPPAATNYPLTSDCQVPSAVPPLNVFAVWPHMHQTGKWFKIDATLGGSGVSIWDQAWSFGDQPLGRLDPPLVFNPGDNVHTECVYDNPDPDNPITYGESSNQEMCFDFFFYYPSLFSGPLPCPFDLF